MRFLGFLGVCALIGALAHWNELTFNATPVLLIFLPYILITTFVSTFPLVRSTKKSFLVLLFVDIVIISLAHFIIQSSGAVLTPLNTLYLIVLIAGSLLGVRSTFALGATALVAYTVANVASSPETASMLSVEYITQIALFILFTMLAVTQSFYFTYITRKRNEESLLLKDQFVFTTAHDLRAPFALIRLLADKYEGAQPRSVAHLREDMQAINTNITVASKLLEDLLRLSKGDNIPPLIVPIPLAPMIVSLLENWEPAMQKKDVHYIYDERDGCTVFGDEQKLRYVLDHVVGNAVKYNVLGGSLRILHEKSGKVCKTYIEDTGCGISKENILKVFTPYFREFKDGIAPGAGLGLYGSKKFIDQMHGTISVDSTASGTRITIALPLKI